MQVTSELTASAQALAAQVEPPSRRIKPIKWWAALGLAYVAFAVYVWMRWLAAGEFDPPPHGPDRIPDYALWSLRTWSVLSPVLGLVCIYVFIVRPWRRERRLTTDGALVIAFTLCALMDPLMNYVQPNFAYNNFAFNRGTWLGSVPGVLTPRTLNPEPLAWGLSFVWIWILPVVLSCALMRRCKGRWPQLGTAGLLTIVGVFWFVFDLIVEPLLFVGLFQAWAYPGAIRNLSLFAGHWYQFPIYEPLFSGFMWAATSAIRWCVDDKGRTFVERGIDDIRVSPRQKGVLRVLATTAYAALAIFGCYYGPWHVTAMYADPFPKDTPSYFLNEMCGAGTPYPCPGPEVPIFRPDSKPPILPPSSE
jgi:hypothetical protein